MQLPQVGRDFGRILRLYPATMPLSLAYEVEIPGVDVAAYDAAWASDPTITVNGEKRRVDASKVTGSTTLLDFLRLECGLTGAKLGCGEGGCGACTVVVSTWDVSARKPVHRSINGCLAPALSCVGCAVTTVEGMGSAAAPHPIQSALAEGHGSQCGFCTPGIAASMYALITPETTVADVEEHLDGNLCRCTGYRPIWDAAKQLCADAKDAANTSQRQGAVPALDRGHRCDTSRKCANAERPALPEIPFPPALAAPLGAFRCGDFWRPGTVGDACALKKHFGTAARFVVGCSEVAVEQRFRSRYHAQYISLSGVPALVGVAADADCLVIGGAAPLNDVVAACHVHEAEERTAAGPLRAAAQLLRWFASTQIRNGASLGGNLATASPISDMNPLLAACRATVTVAAAGGARRDLDASSFFLGYRKTKLLEDEVIESIRLPYGRPLEFVRPYKQSRRREDDIAIVTSTLRVVLAEEDGAYVVREAAFAFGGLAATVKLADATAKCMMGRRFDMDLYDAAAKVLGDEVRLGASAPGGQPEYRAALACSFLFKFFLATCADVGVAVDPRSASGARTFVDAPKPSITGAQAWPVLDRAARGLEAATYDTLHKGGGPLVCGVSKKHQTALLQVTGEARYTDDQPAPAETLHACLVLAGKVGAIRGVDMVKARVMPGVVGVFSAADLPKCAGANDLGAIVHDEECFATEFAPYPGQVVAIAVAKTYLQAKVAAAAVKVDVAAPEKPPPVSIEQAIAAGSYYEMTRHFVASAGWDGDAFLDEPADGVVVVEGEVRVGAQEHFYLECNTTLVDPTDDGGLKVLTSTQAVAKTQACVARVCGLPMHRVVATCKRMGGGFGGKETRSVFASCACALAAKLLQKPVRLSLERDADMRTTGMRHAFLGRYRAAVDAKTLKFVGLDVQLYSNGGASLDLSGPVLDRALLHVDNVYDWTRLRARGVVCKTALPPSTAFRGFGGPQGMVVTEHVVEHLAHALGHGDHGDALRAANMYGEDDVTHYAQPIASCAWRVPRCVARVKETSGYDDRVASVAAFNDAHAHRKRGLALVPTKFGINFTAKLLNQGGSLVHLYTDGTLLVSHGGTEMGQGLHTKVCQVVAQAFGVAIDRVHVEDTASDKVANSAATAASMSTDLYGMAALDACHQILARLRPVYDRRRAAGDSLELAAVAGDAFFNRIDLSAHGFYAVDGARCGYDWDRPNGDRGMPFNYWTQGAAVAEVELDCLTGDFEVRRADVLVDLGCSINPALDVGQIEGAFVQGAGWLTTEELIVSEAGHGEHANHAWFGAPPGTLLTNGPGNYKLPSFNDAPRDFRVELLDRADNVHCVHSSKAVGEPPFFLGASVLFALQHAVQARRADRGVPGYLGLRAPATPEKLRMHCRDAIADAAVARLGRDPATWHASASC